jgi:hypothetical protein
VACAFCGPIDQVLARATQMPTRSLTSAERLFYLHQGDGRRGRHLPALPPETWPLAEDDKPFDLHS